MKGLKNTSVFKISLAIFLIVITNSKLMFLFFFLYFLFFDRKTLLYFLFISSLTFVSALLYTNVNINISNPIKELIIKRIESYQINVSSALKKILLNENDYQNSYNLGYGLSFYYVNKKLSKRNYKLTLILIFLLSIFFGFNIKYLLIIVEIILLRFNLNRNIRNGYLIIIVCLLVPTLIKNYSLLTILVIKLISLFKNDFSINFVLTLFQSLFFNRITITIFIYKYLIYLKMIIIFASIITLLLKPFSNIYIYLVSIYSKLNNIFELGIRGKISLFVLFVIILIIKFYKINNKYIQISLICISLLTPINNPFFSVNFIDVGQGDSILIQNSFKRGNVLIDTGSSFNYNKLKNYLFSKSIYKIDYLVITHNDEDHSGNIENLKKDFMIEQIVEKGKDILINDIKLINIDLGTYDNDNDNSLVYYGYFNKRYFLFTADISQIAENVLVSKFLNKVDVLKVSHHGSKYSSSDYFIGNILPKYAIISTNGKYNHPSKECIDNLNKYLSEVYITKNDGNIEFIFTRIGDFIKTKHFIKRLIKS